MRRPGSRSPTERRVAPAALLAALLAGGAARADDCPDVGAALQQAESDVLAYYLQDAQTALDRVVEGLGCSGPVDPTVHRRYWQAQGMLWSFQGDARWEAAIRASRARGEGWNEDYGEGPERERWVAAAEEPAGEPVTVELRNHTAEVRLWVDGVSTEPPLSLPPGLYLIQGGAAEDAIAFARAFTAESGAVLTVPSGGAPTRPEPVQPEPVVPVPVEPEPVVPEPVEPEPVADDVTSRCEKGQSDACIALFEETRDRTVLQRDCDRRSEASCLKLAEVDPYQADIWLWRACDVGSQAACARVVDEVRDPTQRQRALLRGCQLGETSLCVPARRKARGWTDRYRAHEVACEQGLGAECWRLGRAQLRHKGRFDALADGSTWLEEAKGLDYRAFRPVRLGVAAGAPFLVAPTLELVAPLGSIAAGVDMEAMLLPASVMDGVESLWLAGGIRVYGRRLGEGAYLRLGGHSVRRLFPDDLQPGGVRLAGGEGVHVRVGVRERLGGVWTGFEVGAGSVSWPGFHEEMKDAVGFSMLPFAAVSFGVSP